jgi:endonuclease YncB( thermonuclease family)
MGAVRLLAGGAVLLVCAVLPAAAAASCTAPAAGVGRIEGVVREAAGGDTLCIQTGADHRHLTRLRLLDVQAPRLRGPGGEGAKWKLRRAVRGRHVVCTTTGGGVGVCRIDRVRIGDLLRGKTPP